MNQQANTLIKPLFTGLLLALQVFLLAACATAPEPVKTEPENLVWPLPPETARIRYLGSVQTLDRLAGEKERSFVDILMGEEEEADLSLVKPYGVYADLRGRLFVADTGFPGIPVYDIDSGTVSFWATNGLGAVVKAAGVTAGSNGQLYVSDTHLQRITMYDVNGKYLHAFGGKEETPRPSGMAYNQKNDRLYVADTVRHQVLVYTPEGVLESTFGERGHEEGQFNFPSFIAVDSNGRLYVADSMNFRIQVFEPDGTLVKTIGQVGQRVGDFARLKGVGVDSDGNIYAADASFNNFQVFTPDGQLALYVGRMGPGPGEFWLPAGLYVDHQDRIFIADQYNSRIQMFQYISVE